MDWLGYITIAVAVVMVILAIRVLRAPQEQRQRLMRPVFLLLIVNCILLILNGQS